MSTAPCIFNVTPVGVCRVPALGPLAFIDVQIENIDEGLRSKGMTNSFFLNTSSLHTDNVFYPHH